MRGREGEATREESVYVPRFDGLAGEGNAKSGSRRNVHVRATQEEQLQMAEERRYRRALEDPPELRGEERRIVDQLSRLTRRGR